MCSEFRAESAAYWEFFAREAATLNAPLYARLAEGVRDEAQETEMKRAFEDMLILASVSCPLFWSPLKGRIAISRSRSRAMPMARRGARRSPFAGRREAGSNGAETK